MANIFKNLPINPGGFGVPVDTSAMGKEKSFVVGGDFLQGTLIVQASENGVDFFPLWLFSGAGKKVIPVAAKALRTLSKGISASVNIDVGANDKGALFADLPLPAGNGLGAPVDVSALGCFTTFIATGLFPGVAISIEISEDGNSYFPCGMLFADQGGLQSKNVVANFMRTRVGGRSGAPFSATVSVGAINDMGSGGGVDEKVKVTTNDTTTGFLSDKIAAGSGIALNLLNVGGDEQLEIEVDGADAGDIETGDPITVRGDTNAEGGGTAIARAAHQHRLELEVEDEGVLVSARPRMDFVGDGVGAIDVPGEDLTRVTIPGPNLGDGGAVVERSTYVAAAAATSGNNFVDGMSGFSVVVPIDGSYWAIWEGEFMNSNASAILEVGVGVNSVVAVVANSERKTQGNANDMGAFITSIELGALVAGDLVRGLIRKASGPQTVSVIRRNLTIFKVQ